MKILNGILRRIKSLRERGISFEEIVQKISSGTKIIETEHPNQRLIFKPLLKIH